MDGATVSKLLADKWKMMSDAEKSRWYSEQERMKSLHQLQHPNYKYNPKMRPKKLSMKQSVARIDPTLAPPMSHSELKFRKNSIFVGRKTHFLTFSKVQKNIFCYFKNREKSIFAPKKCLKL